MKIKISGIENADVYVAKSKGYMFISHLDYLVTDGDEFDTRMGWQLYVVGVGNSVFKGTYTIETWVEKGTALPLLVPDSRKP